MDAGDPVIISASTPATQGFGNVPTGFNTDQVKDVKDILSLTTGQIAGIGQSLSCSLDSSKARHNLAEESMLNNSHYSSMGFHHLRPPPLLPLLEPPRSKIRTRKPIGAYRDVAKCRYRVGGSGSEESGVSGSAACAKAGLCSC